MFSLIVVQAAISWGFAYLLYHVGRAMYGITSIKATIEHYEKAPAQGTLIEKYFYGWAFPFNLSLMKKVIDMFGDKAITLWYRGTGIIFLICCVLFALGPVTTVISYLASA